MLDISGFATIPETPRRPPIVAPASLRVLKRPPLEGEYISVTDSSGNRVYLRQKEDTGTKVELFSSNSSVMLNDSHVLASTSSQTLNQHSYSLMSCAFMSYISVSLHLPVSLQVVNSTIVPNSQGALGLLSVPINVLREQELERVSGYKCGGLLINSMPCLL